jgi:hypothetical protein
MMEGMRRKPDCGKPADWTSLRRSGGLVLADGVQTVCGFQLQSRQYARLDWGVCVVNEKAMEEQASGGSSAKQTRSSLNGDIALGQL